MIIIIIGESMIIRMVVGAIKGHGYRIIQYHKDGCRTRMATVAKGETKLRMKKGSGWECYDPSGWNLNSKCTVISEDMANKMLENWGF